MKALGALVLIVTGCSSDPSMPEGPVVLAFVVPAMGDTAIRDHVSATTSALVASMPVTIAIEGNAARIELVVDGIVQPDLVTADVASDVATLVATAYDDAEQVLATASVDVTTTEQVVPSCYAALDLWGVAYTRGPARMGVDEPVTATVPLNGLAWRAVGSNTSRTTLYGDCALILSLARATPIFRARAILEVADYGIYNYRCIGGGAPPCANGISQHAMAKAVDLAAFTTTSGETYVVNDDWVIDPDGEATCEAATEPGPDTFLHELLCALDAARIWNIMLTPNYNADHRNHFHVDLTPNTHFTD